MAFLRVLIAISLFAFYAGAHMQMSSPYPINSPLNPVTPEYLKDYSYTSPLLSDGSDYPCKSYQTQSTSYSTTAIYTAGGKYNMSIAGSAKHGGGSCQLSLSYDNGHTFKVIESMIGGCPITTTYNFTIPSFAPSSQSVLFAWTWFNKIGNREMYMDCARVTIQAAVPGRHRRAQDKRQDSMSSLPDLFVCNVNSGCTTIEQEDVQFPDPGSSVVYGSDDGTYSTLNGTGYTGPVEASNGTALTTTVPSAISTSGAYGEAWTVTASSVPVVNIAASTTTIDSTSTLSLTDTATVAPTPSSLALSLTCLFSSPVTAAVPLSTEVAVSRTPSSLSQAFGNNTLSLSYPSTIPSPLSTISNSTSVLTSHSTTSSTSTTASGVFSGDTNTATSTSMSASVSAIYLSEPCTPGAFACNSATTFSQCVTGVGGLSSYTYMGSVAAGMECSNGQIIRQNDGPCTPSGQLFCNGEYAFYLCDQGDLINMGPLPPGTACVDGTIGYAPAMR